LKKIESGRTDGYQLEKPYLGPEHVLRKINHCTFGRKM